MSSRRRPRLLRVPLKARLGLSGGPEDHALAFEGARVVAMETGADAIVLVRQGRCEDAVKPIGSHLLNQGAMEAHFRHSGGGEQRREVIEGMRDIRKRLMDEFTRRCVGGRPASEPLAPPQEGSGPIEF